VLLYEPQQNKLSFEDITFLGGDFFFKTGKKRIKKKLSNHQNGRINKINL
jgi:hypothetical protein